MVQYYTLEEAAVVLELDVGELKKMAERGEIRGFRDRGTMRFRSQDIDELARRRGLGTNPAVAPVGAAAPPPPAGNPASGQAAAAGVSDSSVFSFKISDESDEVDFGEGMLGSGSAVGSAGASSSRQGPPSSRKQVTSPKPKPGSDSEVRLIADGSNLDFQIMSEGTSHLTVRPASSLKIPSPAGRPESKLEGTGALPRPSRVPRPESHLDSGVRLVAPGDPADSPIRLASDSAARPAASSSRIGKPASALGFRAEDPPSPGDSKRSKAELPAEQIKPRSQVQPGHFPATAPFELSALHEPPPARPGSKISGAGLPAPASGKSSAKLFGGQAPVISADEDVNLGETRSGVLDSGINLQDPQAGGISPAGHVGGGQEDLELSLDAGMTPPPAPSRHDSDFELSLDAGKSPAPASSAAGADGAFELSLDAGSSPPPVSSGTRVDGPFELGKDAGALKASTSLGAPADDDGDFELSLDAGMSQSSTSSGAPSDADFELSLDAGMSPKPGAAASGSDVPSDEFELSLDAGGAQRPTSVVSDSDEADSEFELTLDDSEDAAAGRKAGQERDIFETDFDEPDLADESVSEVVALDDGDTDLASSDFDLDIDSEDASEDDDMSRSQVMALEDDDKPVIGFGAAAMDEEDLTPVGTPDADAAPARRGKTHAKWGIFPALVLAPCLLVMFAVGLLAFEQIRSMWGYHPHNKRFSRPVIEFIAGFLPGGDNR